MNNGFITVANEIEGSGIGEGHPRPARACGGQKWMPGAFLGPSPLYLLCPGSENSGEYFRSVVAGLPGRPSE